MRSGVTLADLREEVLIEAGFSTDAGHSVFSEQRLNQMINRTERLIAVQYEWASLNFEEDVTVPANTRYVDLPDLLTFTMIDRVTVAFGSEWIEVKHGIGDRERSLYNETQRATPIQRWEVVAPGNEEFEVWPVGATAQTLRFSGSKAFGTMEKDTDTCTLDADVIVMRVAAQILGRDNKEDAALLLDLSDSHAREITKRQGSYKAEDISFGRRPSKPLRPGVDYIP